MAIKVSGTTVIDDGRNITNVIGIGDTATTVFYGNGSGLSNTGAVLSAGSGSQRLVVTSGTSGIMTTAATNANLTWNSTTGTLSATNVSIAGTLTYEDVTNVDSIGIVTARAGAHVGTVSGNLLVGTTSDTGTASQRLQVNGGAYISSNLGIGVTNPAGGNTSQLSMSGYNAGGGVGYHQFLAVTNTYGSATNPNKFFRLNSAGGIEIVNSAYGAVIFTFANTGDFTATGNVTGYSDETLKENIQTIPDALSKVTQLRGVEFDRNDIEGNPHQIGVIAQEVEKVIPEVVMTHEDGIKSVAYGNLVGVLIEAIKELKEEVNELKARLEEV